MVSVPFRVPTRSARLEASRPIPAALTSSLTGKQAPQGNTSKQRGRMSSTDALWDELSSETRRQDDRVARLLRRSMAASSKPEKATKPKHKRIDQGQAPTTTLFEVSEAIEARFNDPASRRSVDSSANAIPSGFNLQREVNRLGSELQSERKQAALALETRFLSSDSGNSALDMSTEDEEGDAFAELAKPLFKRFNDRVEKVREVSVRLATHFLAREDDLLRYLPYLMPAVAARIDSPFAFDEQQQEFSRDAFLLNAFKRGRVLVDAAELKRHHEEKKMQQLKSGVVPITKESSEEVRLLLLRLVDAVLRNALLRLKAASILHAYAFDILLVLLACAHDDYHEVTIESCATLQLLSDNLVSVVKHFSVALVRSLAPKLLPNRLARVRIAAIRAIRALVTCPDTAKCKGSGSEAIVDLLGYCDENVIPVSAFYGAEASSVRINYFAKLGQDANPRVRLAFIEMISDWMLNLPDRYDHESRLLPYLLNGLSDDCEDITGLAMSTLRKLGDRYEREQGEEVLEMKQYGVDGKNPTYNYASALPAPFGAGRPSLGMRLFVRARAKRFLNPVLREVGNWQCQTRARALRLLTCILVFCEESVTSELHLLLSTLLRRWPRPGGVDVEEEDAQRLQQIAQLTGRFTAPGTYMPLLLARVRGDEDMAVASSPSAQTVVVLEVLNCVMSGSLDRTLLPHVLEVVEAMSMRHIVELESPVVRRALAVLLLLTARVLDRRGTEAVSAYFLQCGRLPDMERVRQRVFELGNLLVGVATLRNNQGHLTTIDRSQREVYASIAEDARLTLELLVKIDTRKDLGALYAARGPSYLERATRELVEMLDAQWTPQSAVQLAFEQVLLSTDVKSVLSTPSTSESMRELFETVLPVDTLKTTLPDAPQNAETGGSNANKDHETRSASNAGTNLHMTLPPGTSGLVAGSKRRDRYARVLANLLSRHPQAGDTTGTATSGEQDADSANKRAAACLARLQVLAQAEIA